MTIAIICILAVISLTLFLANKKSPKNEIEEDSSVTQSPVENPVVTPTPAATIPSSGNGSGTSHAFTSGASKATVETPISSPDADKPFANLKSNSLGKAEEPVVQESGVDWNASEAVIVKEKSPKKRNYTPRKKSPAKQEVSVTTDTAKPKRKYKKKTDI